MTTGPDACPIDDRIICASSGLVCVAKESMLRQFSSDQMDGYGETLEDEPFSTALSNELDDYDGPTDEYSGDGYSNGKMFGSGDWLLKTKLIEYDVTARRIACGGPVDEDCPSRIAMAESKPRARVLNILRKTRLISR